MNFRTAGAACIALVCGLAFSTVGKAATYQIEGQGAIGESNLEADNGAELAIDNVSITGTYYLRPVDSTTGPLRERSFIDKSAFVELEYSTAEPERGDKSKATDITAQFVTATDMIFLLGYGSEDDGSSEDTTTMSLGIGKYLDGRTVAAAGFLQVDNGFSEFNQLFGTYRKLIDGNAAGTYIAYVGTLGYIDGEDDNGNFIRGAGTYYPSEILGAGLAIDRISIGDFDATGIELSGEYFFAENLFGKISYEIESNSNDIDTTIYALTIGGRF